MATAVPESRGLSRDHATAVSRQTHTISSRITHETEAVAVARRAAKKILLLWYHSRIHSSGNVTVISTALDGHYRHTAARGQAKVCDRLYFACALFFRKLLALLFAR